MATFLFDFREIVRSLARERSYALTVVLTLALTIGATTAMFSIVDGVLLKPLTYPQPERLVTVDEVWTQMAERVSTLPVNERHFEYWREHAQSFDGMAQYRPLFANLTGVGQAEQVTVARTTVSLFDVLGVDVAAGRRFTRDDERADVAIISDALWRQRLNADPAIVGKSVALDGRPYTVVGVLRPDFRVPDGAQLTARVDAFIPLQVNVGWIGDHNNRAVARLREGASLQQAQIELNVLQAQVSDIATREAHEPVTLAAVLTPLGETVVGGARRGLLLLFAALGAVLLIACSNLTNLSLSRTAGRVRETAIRSALGASGRRLVFRAIVEQLVLAIAGGALGMWVAWAAIAAFVRTAPVDVPRVSEVALDDRVLVFAAALSIVAGLVVAIIPAWRLGGRDLQWVLRASSAAVASERAGMRTRNALLAVQVGLSVTLLVVTTLLTTSMLRVLRVDTGFVTARVLAVDLAMPATRYAEEPIRIATYDRILETVTAIPGVQIASTISLLPFGGGGQVNFAVPTGAVIPRAEQASANFRFVGPDYFKTVGIPLLRGRSFGAAERDPSRPTPSVVSEATAKRLWPGEDPLGKRFGRGIEGEAPFEVVGVTIDARTTSVEREAPLMVYLPYWWRTRPVTSLVLKTATEPEALVASVRRVIGGIDPDIAVGQTRTLSEIVDRSLAPRRYQASLFIAFGLVALFIATIGVYAVTAYGVSRRRREMNIRAALGARTSEVLGMVVRQSSVPIVAGVIGGVAGAIALSGTISGLLFDVAPTDVRVIGAVVVLVAGVGLTASLVAARQSAAIDPAAALREE